MICVTHKNDITAPLTLLYDFYIENFNQWEKGFPTKMEYLFILFQHIIETISSEIQNMHVYCITFVSEI